MADLHEIAVEGKKPEYRPHRYRTPHSHSFSIQLQGSTVQAEGGVIAFTEAEHDELKDLVRKGRPDLTQNLIPFDHGMKEAEALVAAHRAQAVRGAANTVDRTDAQKPQTPVQIVNVDTPEGASEHQAQKLEGDGEQLKAAAAAAPKLSIADQLRQRQEQGK